MLQSRFAKEEYKEEGSDMLNVFDKITSFLQIDGQTSFDSQKID